MNLQNIFNELEKVDGEIFDRLAHVSRRGLFSSLTKKTIAVAAPAVMASALNKAYGQTLPTAVVEVLNYALLLERLEYNFYDIGTNLAMIPSQYKQAFEYIRRHEEVHVKLLMSVLGSQASSAVMNQKFDFTAKGTFPTVFSDFNTFAAVAQAFEDTGVRAYKGQATKLKNAPAPAILQVALQIHATEAAHAARIRYLRGQKGWVTGGDGASNGLPAATNGVYGPSISGANPSFPAESNTVQAGIDLTTLGYSAQSVQEAFDEPLGVPTVTAIVTPFLA